MSQTDYENNEAIRLGPIPDSKDLSFGSKGIEFAHQFTGGELALSLNSALNTPSIMSGNGFVNASPAEIASAYLGTFKKKLRLSLSRGIELKPYIHYVVTGNTIVFVGALRDTGGAQAGEILFGQIEQVKANGIIVGDMRWFHGTVEVAVGQTLVNIGVDFKVNENADFQVGDVKLKQNGTAIYRNVGNATAGPTADGHYQENDAGNGYGTTVTLNAAPVGQPALIEYEVGVKLSSGDAQIWSDLERLEGSILALSADAAQGFYGDNDLTRYIASAPSALERKSFGDLVSDNKSKITALEALFASGSWVPVLAFSGGNGTGTITTSYAEFSKVGKSVTVNIGVTIVKGTASGQLILNGLPYAPVNTTIGQLYNGTGALTMGAGYNVKARAIAPGSIDFIKVIDNSEGPTTFSVADLPASTFFQFTCTYVVA